MSEVRTIAIDLAKNVFEVAVSERPGKIAGRHRLRRDGLLAFVAQQPPSTVVLEACGSAHYWARSLRQIGHHAVLLPPHLVRPYVKGRKTDRTDAAGLLEAFRCAEIEPVPIKSPAQQAIVALHRARAAWMQTRTARLNLARGVLRELGVFIAVGASQVVPMLDSLTMADDDHVPTSLRPMLSTLAAEIRELEARVGQVERELAALARQTPAVLRLQSVPGIGLLISTAMFAAVGDPQRFRSGRRLASFLGLTPREHSSGDRRSLGAIHKRGDTYVRMLLSHGARSLLATAPKANETDRLRQWGHAIAERRGMNVATIAVANKLARIAWAVWSKDLPFEPTLLSAP